jgi:hypothetical protein
MQLLMARCVINDNVTGEYIELLCTIKLVICFQVYLALDRQLPMAEATVNGSMPGCDISWL